MQQHIGYSWQEASVGAPTLALTEALTDDQLEIVVGGLHRHPLDDAGDGRAMPAYDAPQRDHVRVT